MPIVRHKLDPAAPLSNQVKRDLKRLRQMKDSDIDTSDIPEWTEETFAHAQRGLLYRPRKARVTLWLDMDLIAWLKAPGPGYQTRINNALRHWMQQNSSPSAKPARKKHRT